MDKGTNKYKGVPRSIKFSLFYILFLPLSPSLLFYVIHVYLSVSIHPSPSPSYYTSISISLFLFIDFNLFSFILEFFYFIICPTLSTPIAFPLSISMYISLCISIFIVLSLIVSSSPISLCMGNNVNKSLYVGSSSMPEFCRMMHGNRVIRILI